jgi:hypothetical protein
VNAASSQERRKEKVPAVPAFLFPQRSLCEGGSSRIAGARRDDLAQLSRKTEGETILPAIALAATVSGLAR